MKLGAFSLIVTVTAVLVASPPEARGQRLNAFGNLVMPSFLMRASSGIPNLANNRDTGGAFPNDEISSSDLNTLSLVALGLAVAGEDFFQGFTTDGAPPPEDFSIPSPADLEEEQERERIIEGFKQIADSFEEKINQTGSVESGFAGASVGLNPSQTVAGINDVVFALGVLENTEELTNDTVQLAAAVVANADPFVVMHGSITNTSPTQSINAFLPFELAFLDPIPLDAPLVREMFISTELRDTDGDGQASLRASEFSFQVLATTDPDNPSLGNTDPIGVSESLGLPRLRSPGVEFFRFADAAEVDDSLFVSQRAQISHTTGQLILEQLSPGDTVDFTAILSLGIEGDPLTPLIPAESLRALVQGAELVVPNVVPEPTSGLLAAFAAATLIVSSHDRRRDDLRLLFRMPRHAQ